MAGGSKDVSRDKLDRLIARARSGDCEALDTLFGQYQSYLRMVITNSMGPALRRELDVSDVIQETLLVASTRFNRFHGNDERELLTWLRALASRKVVDLARRMNRLKRAPSNQLSLDEPQGGYGESLAEQVAGDLTSPSHGAAKREMASKLTEALGQIDALESKVIWLHHVDGMSFERIGQRLGVGRNGARGIWARGLRSLRAILPADQSSGSGVYRKTK